MKKILIGGSLSLFALALSFNVAFAATYTPFGDASIAPGGNPVNMLEANSTSADPGYGGASFSLPSGMTVNDLSILGTDFRVLQGDCGGGAPRFSIKTESGNIFVYIGPAPNFTGCNSLTGWQTTGNLLSGADLRVDATQVGGTFYDTWADAKTLVGNKLISGLAIVVDAGWRGEQSFGFDNVTINDDVTTFDPSLKDQCKKNGWSDFTFPTFKNQGQCVSFFTNGKSGYFAASNSNYYNGPTDAAPLYGTGTFGFTWEKKTGNVTGGYYNEIAPPNSGTLYQNKITGGTVVGNVVNLTFDRTNPNPYHFTFTGTLSGNTLTGNLDGPYLFTATGVVTK